MRKEVGSRKRQGLQVLRQRASPEVCRPSCRFCGALKKVSCIHSQCGNLRREIYLLNVKTIFSSVMSQFVTYKWRSAAQGI